ncbi:Reelin domain-containing protein [Plasmodiophora brassicae]|nr:hypothetical protein PBRA_008823 [Plasmodiophora brassicae]
MRRSWRRSTAFVVALQCCATAVVWGYSTGAGICDIAVASDIQAMITGGMGGPGSAPTQFVNLTFSRTSVPQGGTVMVTATGSFTGGSTFNGILLVSRTGCSTGIGSFSKVTTATGSVIPISSDYSTDYAFVSTSMAKQVACDGSAQSRVTHTSANPKSMPVVFQWAAPSTDTLVEFDVIAVDGTTSNWYKKTGARVLVGSASPTTPSAVCAQPPQKSGTRHVSPGAGLVALLVSVILLA